jgi:hypothetical protein
MKPRAGQTLASTVDTLTVIVVRWPGEDLEITCGGVEMVDPKGPAAGATGTADPAQMAGTQLGKRYADDELGVELLCTKAGRARSRSTASRCRSRTPSRCRPPTEAADRSRR